MEVEKIASLFQIPTEDIFELWYEELEAMRDETGACYFEGTSYFAVITNYGARIEISKEDARFPRLKELLESTLDFCKDTSHTVRLLQNDKG